MLNNITFQLCDINKEIVDAWKLYFDGYDNFKNAQGTFLSI